MGDIFKNLIMGFGVVGNLQSILWILIGVCVGILGGAIPGISPSMAVALLLPMTYAMSPTVALIMLMGIYIGANYGGSITAVAINTPGTPSATVTAFDGYPMLKKGRAGEAMGISLWASVFGGLLSIFILMFFSVPLSRAALKFWPSEYFALCIMGLTTVATLGGKNWQKALVTCLFGLMLNTMGLDPTCGIKRFTFGVTNSEVVSSAYITFLVGFLKILKGLFKVSFLIALVALGNQFFDCCFLCITFLLGLRLWRCYCGNDGNECNNAKKSLKSLHNSKSC